MSLRSTQLLFFVVFIFSQAVSQNYFIVERPGTVRNLKFRVNDVIKLKAGPKGEIINGRIYKISDSTLKIGYYYNVQLKDIQIIYKTRFGFSLLQKVLFFAGVPYLLINTMNGVINNESPVVPQQTLIISGSMIGTAILLTPLTTRKIKIDNEHWRVKILDFTN